jgi:hypothetical protein
MHRTFLAALRYFQVVGVVAACAALGTGCVVEENGCSMCGDPPSSGGGSYAGSGGSPSQNVVLAKIDTGETLTTEKGKGAGVFVEYAEGGRWHVFTSCDFDLYGEKCDWDVLATVQTGGPMTNALIESAEQADGDRLYSDGASVNLVVSTASDFDGMTFMTDPGATVRIDVLLGGAADARYIYWVGDGGVHSGAPSNPIDLKPSIP